MAENEKKTAGRTAKVLLEMKPGTRDGNQVLVETLSNRQLWKNDRSKFGVVKVEANKFIPVLRMGAEEAVAREVLKTGVVPAPAPKPAAPAAPKAEVKPAAPTAAKPAAPTTPVTPKPAAPATPSVKK